MSTAATTSVRRKVTILQKVLFRAGSRAVVLTVVKSPTALAVSVALLPVL
ncbi:hypothetical protein KSC_086660 [Ktedonobacter sp. SOSP1-52]|nr:hypothetical protein [Ktedonobacter sp. SOSP1-52]GHO69774.1 hypothetical protein KSC_086660 [Ktedonobacter sp. SOSP1-52]